jgi:spore maturation protein CgeB
MDRQKLKTALKEVGWIYSLNAAMKARNVRRAYERNVAHYSGKPVAGSAESLLVRRSGTRLRRFQSVQRPLRIFYMGTDELQDRSGILQALESLGELTYFEQSNGTYGQYLKGTRTERQETNTRQLLTMFGRLHNFHKTPDIVFGQLQSHYLSASALDEIRERYGTLVANINMDDRHQYFGVKENGQWSGTYPLIPHIDIALTAAPECVDWYLKEGCPALFFPEASDSEIFHPMPNLPKVHDVSFIGARYGIRERIVGSLRAAGIKVTAYGSGWESGRLSNEDVPRLFAQSKIILGIGTIGHSTDFYALKMRDFDATMSGSCYLTHPNPDLSLLFEVGKEILTYSSCQDCVAKVRYYLEHDEEREAIAAAGHARAEREHTWTRRFSEVFDFLRRAGVREQAAVEGSVHESQ